MSKTLQWLLGLTAVLFVVALAFSMIWPLFAPRPAWGGGFPGMPGPGHMFGGGMMGGGWPLMGLGMLWWPVGVVALGAVWLARGQAGPTAPPATGAAPCSHCGRLLHAGWVACPFCGEKV
jgi:hypothetical protein